MYELTVILCKISTYQQIGNHLPFKINTIKEGIVTKSTGSWYTVRGADGVIYNCRIKGKFRIKGIKSTNPIAVGDHVEGIALALQALHHGVAHKAEADKSDCWFAHFIVFTSS